MLNFTLCCFNLGLHSLRCLQLAHLRQIERLWHHRFVFWLDSVLQCFALRWRERGWWIIWASWVHSGRLLAHRHIHHCLLSHWLLTKCLLSQLLLRRHGWLIWRIESDSCLDCANSRKTYACSIRHTKIASIRLSVCELLRTVDIHSCLHSALIWDKLLVGWKFLVSDITSKQVNLYLIGLSQIILVLRLSLLLVKPRLVIICSNLSLHVWFDIPSHSWLMSWSHTHCSIISVKIRTKSRFAIFYSTHGLSTKTLSFLMELLHLKLLAYCLVDMSGCRCLL